LPVNVRDTHIDGLVVIGVDGELDGSNVALLDNRLSAYLAAGKRRYVSDSGLENAGFEGRSA